MTYQMRKLNELEKVAQDSKVNLELLVINYLLHGDVNTALQQTKTIIAELSKERKHKKLHLKKLELIAELTVKCPDFRQDALRLINDASVHDYYGKSPVSLYANKQIWLESHNGQVQLDRQRSAATKWLELRVSVIPDFHRGLQFQPSILSWAAIVTVGNVARTSLAFACEWSDALDRHFKLQKKAYFES